MNLKQRWLSQLEALRGEGRLRDLQNPSGVDFSSNDYLGYAALPCESAAPELSRSGSASRLLRGHHPIWDEVETALADWHGAEAALVMTSGYVANQGLLSTVIEPTDWLASDVLNHASIIDGLRQTGATRNVFKHLNIDELEDKLRAAAADKAMDSALFVVTESLFSMEGDVPPLRELADMTRQYGAHLIVDEAHATGCFGPTGGGIVDALGLRPSVLATVHTGGKALSVPGAYICCPAWLKQMLVNRCRHFMFTTALPPLVGAWWLDAIRRVQADEDGRRRLHDNAKLFRDELRGLGVEAGGQSFIVLVMLGSDERAVDASARLQAAGFDIRAIRPPTVPDGTARLRISIHADHDEETLRQAAAAVAEMAS